MNNKTLLSVFAFALVVSIMALGFAAANPLDITFSQNPFPSHAGEQLVLNFYVSNNGNTNISNIQFTLDVNDPLDLRSAAEKTISLQAGETKTLNYTVFVASDAEDGTEGITLDYDISGTSYSEDFDVEISSNQVYLQIEQVSSNPEQVAPGSSVTLSITMKNTANSEIRDALVQLGLNGLPFAPESVTEERIALIGKNDDANVQFDLTALSSAELGIYKIPLTLTYQDSFGNEYQRTDVVSVNIFKAPDIDVVLDSDGLIMNLPSNISVRMLNKGIGNVNFAEIRILPSADYDIVGKDYDYVGSIASDDYSSVDFRILPKVKNPNILFNIDYQDVNNKEYSSEKTLGAEAYSVQEARQLGLLPVFPWFLIIIILVIIAVIVFFIVRRNRKKKKMLQQG